MLILTRKPGEVVTIITPDNQKIQVKITQLRGNQIRIRIDAPKAFEVVRDELMNHKDLIV